MTTQTYRRARHSVSMLHAHLVFVTKYRRPVFTDAMLTFCEHTMRTVCADLDVELVEFNGETDHVHLLVVYPPAVAISVLVQRLKGRTAYAVRREFTGACVRARMRGTPVVAVLLRRLLRRRTAVDHQAIHRRTSPPTLNAGPRPATNGMGSPRTEVRGLRPRIPVMAHFRSGVARYGARRTRPLVVAVRLWRRVASRAARLALRSASSTVAAPTAPVCRVLPAASTCS